MFMALIKRETAPIFKLLDRPPLNPRGHSCPRGSDAGHSSAWCRGYDVVDDPMQVPQIGWEAAMNGWESHGTEVCLETWLAPGLPGRRRTLLSLVTEGSPVLGGAAAVCADLLPHRPRCRGENGCTVERVIVERGQVTGVSPGWRANQCEQLCAPATPNRFSPSSLELAILSRV